MGETLIAWGTGTILGVLVVAFWLIAKTNAAVARTERKLDMFLAHAGVDVTAAATREAAALMEAGQKIEAIKVYRELTGAGLAEAKAAVEKL